VSKGARLAVTLVLFAAAAVGVVFAVGALLSTPSTVDFTASGGQVNVTLQTVGSFGSGQHPTWVSYEIQNPAGQWVHTTYFQVPADTQVNVTIYQFDSGSPLRNQQVGQVTGTVANPNIGTRAGEASLNGKPFSVFNSNDPNGPGVGHTFSIPTLGISVPLVANKGTATLCAAAPCDPNSNAYAHNTLTFSFMTPKQTGEYAWQCFVPCGLGWLFGNGGPMQAPGYMDGFMTVA
jgi:hypothetical protein